MKQNTILIGGGVIARHYKKGLENSHTLQLTALVDINENCRARSCYSVPFYTDLQEALELKPRVALLALPVAARREIARILLARNITVFMEKPMLNSLEEIEALYAYADECGTPLACFYHWKYADEVMFLKNNLDKFGKIKSITTTICDDYAYTPDGRIRADRLGLMGAWLDSGINILSYYDEIIDLTSAKLREEILIPDRAGGLPKYARKVFDANGVRAEIIVDWRTESREKSSVIECEKGTLHISHTAQTVRLNGEIIYANTVDDRLSSHYENTFRNITADSAAQMKERTLLLHKLLFKGEAI